MRAAVKAAIFCLIGALVWFAPFLMPGKALLGTHLALFRPFEEALDAETLAAAKAAARPLYNEKILTHDSEVRFSFCPRRPELLPAWNPEVLGGVPHLATGLSSSLHPLMWIAAWIEPPRCYAVIAALQCALAGWFAFLMLRAFDVGPAAAGFGALLFAGSGWMSLHQEYFQLTAAATWLPLALYGAQRIVERRDRVARGTVALGIAVGCAFLSGFPQIAVYVLLAPALLVLCALVASLLRRSLAPADAMQIVLASTIAVVCGLGIAAPQLFATAEFVRWSTRGPVDAATLEKAALPPAALIGALLPGLLGDAPTQAEIDAEGEVARMEGRTPRLETLFGLALADTARGDVRNNPFEIGFSLGPAALALALFGAVCGRRGARGLFVLLAAVGFALALPGPLLHASTRVPGLDIGDPKRALFLAQAALGALAVLGIERALDDERLGRRATRIVGALALVLLALAAVAWIVATPARLTDWSVPRIAASLGVPEGDVRAGLPASLLTRGRERLVRELLQAGLASALACAALAWIARARAPTSGILAAVPNGALFVALALPLALVWHHATSPIPTAGLDAKPPLVQYFLQHPPAGRIVRAGASVGTPIFPPKLPMLFHVRDAQGYVAAFLQSWRDLFEAVEAGSTVGVGIRPLADPLRLALPLFRLLDVEYALVEVAPGAPVPEIRGWSEVVIPEARPAPTGASALHLFRNQAPLGRALIVPTVHVVADERELVRRLVDPACDPSRDCFVDPTEGAKLAATPFLEIAPGPGEQRRLAWTAAATHAAKATLEHAESGVLRFRTSGDGGLLVQSDCWYPGWSARVDGRAVPLLRVDHALRGVVVPAGDHEVAFAYVPRPFLAGLLLAPLALALLLFLSRVVGAATAAIVAPWPTRSDC